MAVQDRPGSTLSLVELHLRLVEDEVEVERLQQVLLLELEEVPQLEAQLLSPLVLSPQLAVSLWRLSGLHACTDLLLASSAPRAVYTSSQQPVVELPAPQLSVAARSVREL